MLLRRALGSNHLTRGDSARVCPSEEWGGLRGSIFAGLNRLCPLAARSSTSDCDHRRINAGNHHCDIVRHCAQEPGIARGEADKFEALIQIATLLMKFSASLFEDVFV